MSLYQVQKFLFDANRDREFQARYLADPAEVLQGYVLTDVERRCLLDKDIRALYVMGTDGLLLLPFAQLNGFSITDYKARLAGLD